MSKGLRVADLLREEFGIEGRIDYQLIEDICFAKKAYVKLEKIEGAQGRILFSKESDNSLITINSGIKHIGKKKFVLAHELDHRLLHYRKMNFICNNNDFNTWNNSNRMEFEANEFASELIMPEKLVRSISNLSPFSKQTIIHVSDELGSSITSSAIPLTKYGQIPICIIFSSNGRIEWFSKSTDFYIRHFERGEYVLKGSLAYKYFTSGKKEYKPSVCLANFWDPKLSAGIYFYEQCFYFENYNTVITILWYCEDY
jgi:Zn-dependent peptidase ImmA (M78 family)